MVVGCGSRGGDHLKAVSGESLVAVVNVDDKKLASHHKSGGKVETFTGYRRMFDKMHKQIGNLAQHVGMGNKDGAEMKVTNLPDLNRFVVPSIARAGRLAEQDGGLRNCNLDPSLFFRIPI